jgi:hypothetical protein
MSTGESPQCPRCARSDLELISSRPVYQMSDKKRERPYATSFVFKCQCGAAFTRDVPMEDDGHLRQISP